MRWAALRMMVCLLVTGCAGHPGRAVGGGLLAGGSAMILLGHTDWPDSRTEAKILGVGFLAAGVLTLIVERLVVPSDDPPPLDPGEYEAEDEPVPTSLPAPARVPPKPAVVTPVVDPDVVARQARDASARDQAEREIRDQGPGRRARARKAASALHERARMKAVQGDCPAVKQIEAQLIVVDAEFHKSVFVNDAILAPCLSPAPAAPASATPAPAAPAPTSPPGVTSP